MNTNNHVELIGWYGGDESHATSAWTSTSRELTPEKKARIPALLKMLAEGSDGNAHGTPFEKSALHFLVTSEIASHIHMLKHRIGISINAESARYKELKEDKYFLPNDWPVECQEMLAKHSTEAFKKYHAVYEQLLTAGYSKKRAKESARFFLPYNTQLACDIQFNFRSFVNFLKLRNKDGAQLEIHKIAEWMLKLIKEIPDEPFKYSIEAWKL